MKCPVCENKQGFSCGTCIDCGYNYIDNTFHFIKIATDLLKLYVSKNIFNDLVSIHEKTQLKKGEMKNENI